LDDVIDKVKGTNNQPKTDNPNNQQTNNKGGGLLGDILDDVIDKVKGTNNQPKTDKPTPPTTETSGRVKAKPRLKQ
jgi:hypothetical protein